jgi:hypothetical protein
MAKTLSSFLVLLLAAGCASFDGQGLAPGASEADVVARMGKPVETLARSNGDKVLFYPRMLGRQTYAATFGPDGRLRAIEPRLNQENIARVALKQTKAQVRELLGPPYRAERGGWPRNLEVWEYIWRISEDQRVLWVEFAEDGTVREVIETHDFTTDPPSGPATKD